MQGPWRADYAAWLRPRLAEAVIVHAHHGAAWWQAVQAVDDHVPLIAHEHSVPAYSPVILDQLRRAAPRVDEFWAVGPGVRRLARSHGIPAGKTRRAASPISVSRSSDRLYAASPMSRTSPTMRIP